MSEYESSEHEASEHEASEHEASEHEASEHEASEHEDSEHEASEHEASEHDGSEHDEDAKSTHPEYQHNFPLDDESGNEYELPTPPDDMHRPDEERQHYGPIVPDADGEDVQPLYFRLSQATGKRKALLIGCNYPGGTSPLRGCCNDVFNIKRFLIDHFQYDESDIRVLTDDQSSHGEIGEAKPTGQNIVDYIRWLVNDAEADDSLFFFYSGHGGNMKDTDGDEHDGMDECICPTDYSTAGVLLDDFLYDIMVKPLPEGAGLTALFDSCHSGSVLDLPWTYETGGTIKAPEDLEPDAQAEALGTEGHKKRYKWSPADVVSLSGCRDNQYSADAQFGGLPSGALSYAFIRAFHKFPELTYDQLLRAIFNELKGKFDQRPQLSCSHPIDMDMLFVQ
ncbi:unnamed protein product [Rhizoctonia solani]|uniref:Peptidase C14 caspase domain-containing protein n=1 Tax=Rhizoctonia solani TaxID=456999 RepID=A0A8H3ADG6_9AGAM|nr:unnamed protein product [Rhizoctonia solani]